MKVKLKLKQTRHTDGQIKRTYVHVPMYFANMCELDIKNGECIELVYDTESKMVTENVED